MAMGNQRGDAKCCRWPPGPIVAAVHGSGRPSIAAALGPGGPIVGGTIGSVTDLWGVDMKSCPRNGTEIHDPLLSPYRKY